MTPPPGPDDPSDDQLADTLSASRATKHSLGQEFERLRDYLELMQMRMGPRLQFTLELPDDLRDVAVPTLLLQPLVENAVVHGLDAKLEGGQVRVSASRNGRQLQLCVQDSGAGLPVNGLKEGFGITQVRERLATSNGANATFSIASYADNTRATIELVM